MRITRQLAAVVAVPLLALAACSGDNGGSNGNATTGAGADESTPAAAAPPAEKAKDVKFDKCEVDDGVAQVEATVTNSGDAKANVIVAVEVQQNDKRVDGVGLIFNGVEPGKTGKASERGTKADLKGDIECVAASVDSVAG